jgi:hypothetical protein
MTAIALVLADLDIFGVPTGDPDITVFIALSAGGFAIGVFGHLVRSNLIVGFGIALVFIAIILLPLLTFGSSG